MTGCKWSHGSTLWQHVMYVMICSVLFDVCNVICEQLESSRLQETIRHTKLHRQQFQRITTSSYRACAPLCRAIVRQQRSVHDVQIPHVRKRWFSLPGGSRRPLQMQMSARHACPAQLSAVHPAMRSSGCTRLYLDYSSLPMLQLSLQTETLEDFLESPKMPVRLPHAHNVHVNMEQGLLCIGNHYFNAHH